MDVLTVLDVVAGILLILGLVCTVLGLVPATRAQLPYAFAAGVTMLAVGFAVFVVLLAAGGFPVTGP